MTDAFNEQVQTVVFQFRLRQIVKVKELSRPGIVTGCLVDHDGISYRVAYWNNGDRKSEWLFAEELEPA